MINKEFYEAPSTTVVEVKCEGVVCASGNPNGFDNPTNYLNGGDPFVF